MKWLRSRQKGVLAMPDVEEAWAAAFQAVAWGYPEIVRQRRMAAVRDAMLASARDAIGGHFCKGAGCEWCEKLDNLCARIQALAEGRKEKDYVALD